MGKKEKDADKINDRMSNLGTSAVYRDEKLKKAIKEAMNKDGMKEAVMAYIFDGNPDSENPLKEIRDEN